MGLAISKGRAGVIGHPVAHTLSPVIHREWARREGRSIAYEPIDAPDTDDAFAAAIKMVRAARYAGVNVTIPHKERALMIADVAAPQARAVGAANMLSFENGGIIADNSDVAGVVGALAPAIQNARPVAALVLGAGGAARSVLFALTRRLGLARVIVANRSFARARALAETFGAEAIAWETRSDAIPAVDLLVNATSLGMTGAALLDIDLDRGRAGLIVCDIVYAPLETPLLGAARARGFVGIDGLDMLMHQAAPGYRRWLGETAVVDAGLRMALLSAIEARP